jgi:hypothetical protein
MKRKLGLLGVVVGAVALALVGVLQDVSTSKALMPLPVRPIRPGVSVGGSRTTVLGGNGDVYSDTTGARGERGGASANWSRDGYGLPDISIDDGVALGSFTSLTDYLCVSIDDKDGGIVANDDGAGNPVGIPFTDESTDLAAAGKAYLLAKTGYFPMNARFESNVTNIFLFGSVPTTVNPPVPVNILTLNVPWAPAAGVSQIWVGGDAAKPSALCTDSAENLTKLPKGAHSETLGSQTTPVWMTAGTPPRGDAAGPCTGGNCVDKQVYGFWPDKSIVDASGGAQVVTVTERALNASPNTGNFKDVWHVEAPAGVTASWGATITERHWDGSAWVSDSAPTISGSGAEISFVEDSLAAGSTYEDAGSLNISCASAGDYIVSIKAVSYPVSPTVDNDLSGNASVSAIRVKCPAATGEVDNQVSRIASTITALSGGSGALNLPLTPVPPVVMPPRGDEVQLLVGDTATVNFDEILRNQGTQDAASRNWLVAEAPDMNGDGTYDITLNWVDGSTTAVYGSDPDALTSISVTDTCIAGGGMACAGLDIAMTQPDGPEIEVNADLQITCAAAGRYLVPVKAVDMPTTLGDSLPTNNAAWQNVTVYCWASAGDKTASDDGIDDASGLYPGFSSSQSEADLRKPVSPTSKPATGSPADSGYVERLINGACHYLDSNGAPDLNSDGWISETESLADPNMPAGIDDDGDCLADAAAAQPGKPVDYNDVAGTAMCPAIVYDEGNAPYAQVQYLQSADEDCDGLIDGNEYVFGSNPRLADSDSDGASDFFEVFQFTNPLNPDTDGDGYKDAPAPTYQNSNTAYDNCPIVFNPTQANNDGMRRDNGTVVPGSWASNPNQDKLGDACDEDDDNDRSLDIAETTVTPYTDPMKADSDGDGCVDGWEAITGKDPNSAASKCPASLTAAQQTYARGCHLNLPGTAVGPSFAPGYAGTQWVEMDVDGDGLACQSGSTITDADSDDGTGSGSVAPVQIVDSVEAMGYNLLVSNKDTDGDGCEDWIEIVDINGNRSAELLDVLFVAKRALGVDPAPGSDKVLDIDKNGAVTILDALVAAKNSSLVKSHSPCASEG